MHAGMGMQRDMVEVKGQLSAVKSLLPPWVLRTEHRLSEFEARAEPAKTL